MSLGVAMSNLKHETRSQSPNGSLSGFFANIQNAQRDFEFSTSSVHDITDGAFLDLDDASYDNVSTSAILHYCKQRVLKPYFRMHSLLGWRPLYWQATRFENNFFIRLTNWCYTALILVLICTGYVLQHASCYRQDGIQPYRGIAPGTDSEHKNRHAHNFVSVTNATDKESDTYEIKASLTFKKGGKGQNYATSFPEVDEMELVNRNLTMSFAAKADATSVSLLEQPLKCRGNFFALYLIPDVLHFCAYLFILHLMRTPESERLENLMERGFLQTSHTTGWMLAHRKLVSALRSFLWVCVGWLFVALAIHGMEVGARFYSNRLDFTWMHPSDEKIKIFLVCLTIGALTWNDLICGAIVTSYAVHCQLNISYIINLCASIRERRVEFQEFYKRIEESRKFLDYLNNDQALGVSLLQINIGCKLSVALFALLASPQYAGWTPMALAVVLLSIFFWLSLFAVPLIQAVRLTSACRELQKIGHELRSRPFGYQEAQQQDLDSLLLYTTTLSMEAKILHVPIRSSCVVIVCVLILIVILMMGQLGFLNV